MLRELKLLCIWFTLGTYPSRASEYIHTYIQAIRTFSTRVLFELLILVLWTLFLHNRTSANRLVPICLQVFCVTIIVKNVFRNLVKVGMAFDLQCVFRLKVHRLVLRSFQLAVKPRNNITKQNTRSKDISEQTKNNCIIAITIAIIASIIKVKSCV